MRTVTHLMRSRLFWATLCLVLTLGTWASAQQDRQGRRGSGGRGQSSGRRAQNNQPAGASGAAQNGVQQQAASQSPLVAPFQPLPGFQRDLPATAPRQDARPTTSPAVLPASASASSAPAAALARAITSRDGRLSRELFDKAMGDLFAAADKNGDGVVDGEELQSLLPIFNSSDFLPALFKACDTNGDGKLSPRECGMPLDRFQALDTNGDGFLSFEEWRSAMTGPNGSAAANASSAKAAPAPQSAATAQPTPAPSPAAAQPGGAIVPSAAAPSPAPAARAAGAARGAAPASGAGRGGPGGGRAGANRRAAFDPTAGADVGIRDPATPANGAL